MNRFLSDTGKYWCLALVLCTCVCVCKGGVQRKKKFAAWLLCQYKCVYNGYVWVCMCGASVYFYVWVESDRCSLFPQCFTSDQCPPTGDPMTSPTKRFCYLFPLVWETRHLFTKRAFFSTAFFSRSLHFIIHSFCATCVSGRDALLIREQIQKKGGKNKSTENNNQ